MSDTDQVLESVADAEPNEPVVTEAPEEVAVSEAADEPEVTEEVSEEPEEVAISEAAEEPEVTEEVAASEPVEEPAPEAPAPVTTQEVVQNVQEILSSTETNVSVDNSESNDLENRVKVLEERLEKLILLMKEKMGPQIKIVMKSI